MWKLAIFLSIAPLLCGAAEIQRPKILGVAHMAIYVKDLARTRRFYEDHVSLMVPDAQKALDELRKRAARGLYDKEIAIQTGVNRKRQINLYDPDGTRIELMEATTIDGQPAPSSTAPPPRSSAMEYIQ